MKSVKKSNILVSYLIVFLFLFFPLLIYELDKIENLKEKKISELEYKSLILDLEYKEIKQLVKKYGTKKEFLNSTNE